MAIIPGKIGRRSKWVLLRVTILVFIGCGVANISVAQAQSFQRVYKNGVIYYYFSSRGEGGPRQAYFRSGENRIIRPPASRKVSPLDLEPVVE